MGLLLGVFSIAAAGDVSSITTASSSCTPSGGVINVQSPLVSAVMTMKGLSLVLLCAIVGFRAQAYALPEVIVPRQQWCNQQDAEVSAVPLQWARQQLEDTVVLGKPDVIQCYKAQLPAAAEGNHELTRLTLNAGQTAVHKAAVYDCPADFWVVQEMLQDEGSCMQHTSALLAVCNKW